MIYIFNKSNKPDYNIALEEYCFKQLTSQDSIFILWINEPTIVVGKYQNTIEEINTEYVKTNNINVVRRISGGGAVYHDLNNLNYTIIASSDQTKPFDFKTFSQPVIETLADLGVEANFTGRNDLEIEGQKFCGNAQAYTNNRVMHHGCLLFDVDLTVLSEALKVSKDKIQSKGVKSVRSRVTNILPHLKKPITVTDFAEKLLQHMLEKYPDMEEYVFSAEEQEKIEQLRLQRNACWDWVYGKSPEYNIIRDKRFEGGKIQVYIDVKESCIENLKFYGDFFSVSNDLYEIEQALKGVRYTKEDVAKHLNDIDKTKPIAEYFTGFTAAMLAEVIAD